MKERSELFFVCLANDRKVVESSLAKIADYCTSSVDAEVLDHHIEWL